MSQTAARQESSSAPGIIPTFLWECYLTRVSMDKGRGTDASSTIRSYQTVQVSPKWRRLLKHTGIRRVTLLKYLFSAWYRRALEWREQDLFRQLLEDFARQDAGALLLLRQLKHNPIKRNSYLEWCELGWRGCFRVPDPLELEDFRWQLESFCRRYLFSQRALHGLVLNRRFIAKLGWLLAPFRRENIGKKIKRRRKIGHTDHGSVPSDSSVREANLFGGEEENRSLLRNRLVWWIRSLLPP